MNNLCKKIKDYSNRQACRQSLKSTKANIAEKKAKYCFPCQKVVLGGFNHVFLVFLGLIAVKLQRGIIFWLKYSVASVASAWLRA